MSYNSVVWTRDPNTLKPILCVAGKLPKQIQLLDIETGARVRSLLGHGRGINDLAISPLAPYILASASEDYTIRLWDLRPEYASQPCIAVFAGEGHRQPILAIKFHPNGRWLLSGGLDTAVALWAVPSLADLQRTPEQLQRHHDPITVFRPHFHSTEVHSDFVDCLDFYGDLIISRCARTPPEGTDTSQRPKSNPNELVLWQINGFDANSSTLPTPPVLEPNKWTRSAFPPTPGNSVGFTRLLTFDMPHTDRFYNRFDLLNRPGMRPLLAMGNQESAFCFWDLQKLEEGYDASDPAEWTKKTKAKRKGAPPRKLTKDALAAQTNTTTALSNLNLRAPSVHSDANSSAVGGGAAAAIADLSRSTSVSIAPERKFDLSDPMKPLLPHCKVTADTKLSRTHHFGLRQLAWSPDGKWMVGVGDTGMMCIFHREVAA